MDIEITYTKKSAILQRNTSTLLLRTDYKLGTDSSNPSVMFIF